jgi:hypothetical protein
MVDWVVMICGWLLAALAPLLADRLNADRRIVAFRRADSTRMAWRIAVPYFLGLVLAVFGAAGLQQRSFGLWAIPLAMVPLVVAYVVPVGFITQGSAAPVWASLSAVMANRLRSFAVPGTGSMCGDHASAIVAPALDLWPQLHDYLNVLLVDQFAPVGRSPYQVAQARPRLRRSQWRYS